MALDLQQLTRDLIAIREGDSARLAASREKFPQLTLERVRAIPDVEAFLRRRFPDGGLPYRIRLRDHTIETNALIEDSDWDTVFDVMREHALTAIQAGESMTDEGLLHLAQRNDVEVAKLGVDGWHGRLTDEGLSALARMPRLRDIQLCWQQRITDTGIANLRNCTAVEIVNLMGTNTGDAAIEALAGKVHLRKLFTGRQVTDDGIAALHEIPRFKLRNTQRAEFGLTSFDAEPVHLLLDGPITGKGIRRLQGLEGLSGLSFFWHTNNLTASSLRHLPEIPFLSIDGKLCDDEAMRHLGPKPGLRMLLAQGSVATAAGYKSLSQSQTIEYIWGRECEGFDSDGFRALAAMPALKGFAIGCGKVDDHALALLPEFPALTEFLPMDFTDDGFRHIGRCVNLESLVCMYCRETGDAATEHIVNLPNLKRYYAGATKITDRSLAVLARMPSLERIELWGCAAISDAGIDRLAQLPNLQAITVHECAGISPAVQSMFASGVTVDYNG